MLQRHTFHACDKVYCNVLLKCLWFSFAAPHTPKSQNLPPKKVKTPLTFVESDNQQQASPGHADLADQHRKASIASTPCEQQLLSRLAEDDEAMPESGNT